MQRHDDELEDVLAGRPDAGRADRQALAAFVTALRSTARDTDVRPELEAIFNSGSAHADREFGVVPSVPAIPPLDAGRQSVHPSRRRRVLQTLSAFVATIGGKVVFSAAAVAVSVAGSHVAGVVDIPGLPDRVPVSEVDAPAVDDQATDPVRTPLDTESGRADDPGVDGGDVSERATSGEPREDGRAFGDDVSDEATEGTPAEGLPGNRGDIADERRGDDPGPADPGTPSGGTDTADDARPDETGPRGGPDDDPPGGIPDDRP